MSTLESWLLSCLLNSLWQIPVLFVAGLLVAHGLRRISPAAEHRAWVGALLLGALLPMASALPLDGLLTRLGVVRAPPPVEGHVTVLMGAGSTPDAFILPHGWLIAIASAYAAVCLWFAARFLWRCVRLRAIRRDARSVILSGEAAACWMRCSHRFGLRGVAVVTSPRIFGPVTIGLLHKLVILPAGLLEGAEPADLDAVLAHEFAHIRRDDFVKNLLCELIALPVSYHPLFWAMRERIMESREMVCDQMAAACGSPSQYARSLLRLAHLLLEGMPVTTPHAIGIFDSNSFERRLMRLTENSQPLGGLRRIAIVAACALFGIGVGSSALALHVSVNPQGADSKPANPSKPIAVSPKIMQGQRINGPMPVYPPDAKKARIQGKVLLDAVIGKDGSVVKLDVKSGPEALRQSALDAVHQWTYKPFLLNGEPVEVTTTITVVYSLEK
jgi:bla regulator protein blaR1